MARRDSADDITDELRAIRPAAPAYALTRFVFLRLLGLVYFVAFLSLARQLDPLLGSHGLLPISDYVENLVAEYDSTSAAFADLPTIWLFGASDAALQVGAWIGVLLSLAMLCGVTNALLQLVVWALYLSYAQVGQTFYSFGWESQLCETGFLAVFLCPIRTLGPFPATPPPTTVIVLSRWFAARIMLGAGLIKIRGDVCWRDLTCLATHYETQPVPNPVSWVLHQMPLWFHKIGVLANHAVELLAPFFAFGPRKARLIAGTAMIAFQVTLIVSGNLSFLNWLTIIPAIACLDDEALARVLPRAIVERAALPAGAAPGLPHRTAGYAYALVVAVLSLQPMSNLLSSHQAMNRSFDPLRIVNTYGAFGSVSKVRHEVVIEGTSDAAIGPGMRWVEYELPCKPGDVMRRPCVISPYHYRLDWQMWFAALSNYQRQPWIVRLASKLLQGDRVVMRLFANDPFPDAPPRYVRALLYRYSFTRWGDGSDAWWKRELVGEYIRPLSVDDPGLAQFLEERGWDD